MKVAVFSTKSYDRRFLDAAYFTAGESCAAHGEPVEP